MNGKKIPPIWIADYVLISYGTGAIMAVPAHDTRDWEFAKKFDLPIIEVLKSAVDVQEEAWTEDGIHVNSDFINGLNKEDAIEKMITWLEERKVGTKSVNYKLRDWIFSRQRYWGGEPIPLVHCPTCEQSLFQRISYLCYYPRCPAMNQAVRVKAHLQRLIVGYIPPVRFVVEQQNEKPIPCPPSGQVPAGTTCAILTQTMKKSL